MYLLLGDILAIEHKYLGAAEQKRLFLTIVSNAYVRTIFKEQIRILGDLAKGHGDEHMPQNQSGKRTEELCSRLLQSSIFFSQTPAATVKQKLAYRELSGSSGMLS